MYYHIQRYSIICLLLFVAAGCKKNKKASIRVQTGIDYREIMALHSEIPDIMLGYVVERVTHDKDNHQIIEIVYKPVRGKVVSQEDIQKSYIADMELLGWKLVGEFAGETIQLLFERPKSTVLCSLYIQHDGTIRVTLLQKTINNSEQFLNNELRN